MNLRFDRRWRLPSGFSVLSDRPVERAIVLALLIGLAVLVAWWLSGSSDVFSPDGIDSRRAWPMPTAQASQAPSNPGARNSSNCAP